MANSYVNEVTASQSTTQQSRIIRCNVTSQLSAGNTITLVTTNSAGLCIDIVAFTHVASGAAANTHTGTNASSTGPASGALTTTSSGDVVLGTACENNSPTVSSLRDSLGNTMTQINTTQSGQSRTSHAMYLVEASGLAPSPTATLSTAQAWAACGARWNNDGTTAAIIASSGATSGWTADPGNKTFTVNIPVGVTVPVGATLFMFLNSNGNTGANTITDNGGATVTNKTLTATQASTATLPRVAQKVLIG